MKHASEALSKKYATVCSFSDVSSWEIASQTENAEASRWPRNRRVESGSNITGAEHMMHLRFSDVSSWQIVPYTANAEAKTCQRNGHVESGSNITGEDHMVHLKSSNVLRHGGFQQ